MFGFSPLALPMRGALVGAIAAVTASGAASGQVDGSLVLAHANVVDVHDGSVHHDVNVAVQGDRIIAVTPSKLAGRPDGRIIDLHGAYVAPGFMDMHAHPLDSPDPVGSLQLMLAEGITGVRQMSGSPELLQRRREGRLLPTPDSPAILAMPGTILTRANAATPEVAVAEVDRQHVEGADFVKEIDLPPPVFFPVAAETRRLGTTFSGHLSSTVDVRKASEAGMRSIEHLGPRDSILLGCSTAEAALRASPPSPSVKPPVPPGPKLSPQAIEGVIRRALINPILATSSADFPRYERVLDTFDASKCDELASEFRAHGTWQVPTLIRLRTMEMADDPAYLSGSDLLYAYPVSRREWASSVEQFKRQITAEQRRSLDRLFQAQLNLVRRFQKDGVPLLAGSDFGGGLEVAGLSLHREFDLLSEAGLTPLQVLQATTENGARFLNASDRLGRVEAGHEADLVVLAGDPTMSVANLHRILAVVRGGRYYDRGALDDLLRGVRTRYAAPDPDTQPATAQ